MQKKIQAVWNNKKIQILKAAQQIFARYGYFKSTMDDIAQAMGMKKGSLYYYYKSKEDILKDVVNYESEQFLNALQKEIESLKTPQEKILRFLQFRTKEFMQLMNLHQVSIQAFLEATSILSEMYQECFEKEINLLTKIINEGIKKGLFFEYDALKIAKSMLTFAEAVHFREFYKNKKVPIYQIDYSSIEEEILFTIKIMLAGISK